MPLGGNGKRKRRCERRCRDGSLEGGGRGSITHAFVIDCPQGLSVGSRLMSPLNHEAGSQSPRRSWGASPEFRERHKRISPDGTSCPVSSPVLLLIFLKRRDSASAERIALLASRRASKSRARNQIRPQTQGHPIARNVGNLVSLSQSSPGLPPAFPKAL